MEENGTIVKIDWVRDRPVVLMVVIVPDEDSETLEGMFIEDLQDVIKEMKRKQRQWRRKNERCGL